MGRGKRRKAQPTDEWQEQLPLFSWPEQRNYEELRPLVLFGASVAERARETGTAERTLYRRVERFERDGMISLFATDPAAARARRQGLEPVIRRMIVELKAEHPKLNANEIANIVYVRTGRRLGKHTPGRVLAEEVVPLKLSRLFDPYHEAKDVREARAAVVALHLDGWSVKAIASYMRVSRTTVYRVLGRWIEEGDAGLEDRPPGRPRGVRKMDLATMDFIRRSQENPELGAFRVHAALVQKRGAEVSVRTVGRVMAVHRDLYGLGKPKRSPREKAEMPFRAKRRHEIWTADVRYVPHSIPNTKTAYVIAILARAHDTWGEDYNAQTHWAHEGREDGRHSPQDVLGFYTALLRHREEDLRRAFFSTRFIRVLDALGYIRFLDWKLYGEEALAKKEAAVWLQPGSLTLEYGGQTLSVYDVELASETGKPTAVRSARLFETTYVLPQLKLFALEEAGWLTALKLEEYAPRRSSDPMALQEVLFPYLDAL